MSFNLKCCSGNKINNWSSSKRYRRDRNMAQSEKQNWIMTKFKSVEALGHDKRPTIGFLRFLSILLSANLSCYVYSFWKIQKQTLSERDVMMLMMRYKWKVEGEINWITSFGCLKQMSFQWNSVMLFLLVLNFSVKKGNIFINNFLLYYLYVESESIHIDYNK